MAVIGRKWKQLFVILPITTYYIPPQKHPIDSLGCRWGEESNTQYLVVMVITTYYFFIITYYYIITT